MRSLLYLMLLVAIAGCTPQSEPPSADRDATNPPADSTSEIADGEDASEDQAQPSLDSEDDFFVIDVRSKDEWDSGHIDQAVHIPHTEISERIDEVTEDKDAKIVVYCAVGGRAGKAKAKLEELGYTNVENGGGLDDMRKRLE